MIKATIQDRAALATIRPENVVAYLKAHGWQRVETSHGGRVETWRPQDGEGEALVLLDRSFADYTTRMYFLVKDIAESDGRSGLDVFLDLGGDLGEREP